MIIDWTQVSKDDSRLCADIASRALGFGDSRKRLDILMDLEAVHASVGLRLAELLAADDFNFQHDVDGIRRHLNRETGELGGHFLPRFARQQVAAA